MARAITPGIIGDQISTEEMDKANFYASFVTNIVAILSSTRHYHKVR